MNSNKLMLIDGNSILNRAFYGLSKDALLATKDGLFTNGVFGFINILNKYLEEEKPNYLCVAFDLKAPTFRHKEFDGYKAKRKGMPPELSVQVPVIKEVLDAMNIKRVECEGFEADDIIGTGSLLAQNNGIDVCILTGDRDALQLASATTKIMLISTKGGRPMVEAYDEDKVFEKYGVKPVQLIEVKGLMGDASDNIPGVPGIGEKTALDLIIAHESLENLYDNLDKVSKKGVKQKLEDNRELAFLSKRLATIDRNVPCFDGCEDMIRKEIDKDQLYNVFCRLEFKSFLDKYNLKGDELPRVKDIDNYVLIDNSEMLDKALEDITKDKLVTLFTYIDKKDFNITLTGICIGLSKGNQFFIDARSIGEDLTIEKLRNFFESGDIKKVGHDLKNVMVYLRNHNIIFNGAIFDTMIASYILNPSRDTFTISEAASDCLNETLDPLESMTGKGKDFKLYSSLSTEILLRSALKYVDVINRIYPILDKELLEKDMKQLYDDIELPLLYVLTDMEYYGFKVNVWDLKGVSVELDEKIKALVSEIYELAGEAFNINSTKQLGVILFDKLDLPVIKKTKTGYSTDAEVLEQLATRHGIIPKLLDYRQLMKLKSTYVEGLMAVINPNTGKIHSSFNQAVTATGRISSTEPNLQNIPIKLEMGREIRKVFIPESDEYVLVDADYSQIELRILAHITGDKNMINAFENNEDIHTSTASKVFGVEMKDVTSLMRSRAKAVNFGIVYGIGDFSLSKDLGVTRSEAKKYIEEYFEKYPGVKQYMHEIVKKGKENGFVTTLFNRRRYIPELKSSNFNIRSFGERVAMNTPIQGSAADIIKIAMVKVYNELRDRNLKSRLILQVHDELIVETHVSEIQVVKDMLNTCMEQAAKLSVPLLVETKNGKNWYESK